ncbi:hypothetical protein, partial [Streptomyces sp. NPDC054838]
MGLALTGSAGGSGPLVDLALYGAGALLAPPRRVPLPAFPPPARELAAVRADFARLREYVAEVELTPKAGGRPSELLELYEALLDPGWVAEVLAAEPEAVRAPSRAIRLDVPECVDGYHRARWWNRLAPGGESPERHLERQLSALLDEA